MARSINCYSIDFQNQVIPNEIIIFIKYPRCCCCFFFILPSAWLIMIGSFNKKSRFNRNAMRKDQHLVSMVIKYKQTNKNSYHKARKIYR